MRILRRLRHRLRALFRGRAVDGDLDRELGLHLEALAREYVAAGLSEPDARRAAQRAFGSTGAAREACRDTRRVAVVEDLIKDASLTLRGFRRARGSR